MLIIYPLSAYAFLFILFNSVLLLRLIFLYIERILS